MFQGRFSVILLLISPVLLLNVTKCLSSSSCSLDALVLLEDVTTLCLELRYQNKW